MSNPSATSHSSGHMRTAPSASSCLARVVLPAPASPHRRISRPLTAAGSRSSRQDSRHGGMPAGRKLMGDGVTDSDVKKQLHLYLSGARETLVWKLDGLSEYDMRHQLATT